MKSKMGRLLTVIALICLVTGLAVLLYPTASQWIYARRVEGIILDYEARVADDLSEQTDIDWLYALIQAYNRDLYESHQEALKDPFAYEQVDFSLVEFGFDEEMIGYLEIGRMGIRLPVYLGASQENMAKGAAHLTQTSIPVGGENTNAVIAAHRGMSTAAMFRDIELLEIGDIVTLTNFRETLAYQVCEIQVISPTDAEKILIQEGRDLLTLLTCHPYRANSQRYLVYCERIIG